MNTTIAFRLRSIGAALFCVALLIPAFAAEPEPPPLSKGWTFDAQDGGALFRSVCQGCHMPDAKGAKGAGAYPALAGNLRLASAGYVLDTVLNGRKGMPGLGIFMSDAQAAAVANYVRTNFGNQYKDTVAVEDVKPYRRPAKGLFED